MAVSFAQRNFAQSLEYPTKRHVSPWRDGATHGNFTLRVISRRDDKSPPRHNKVGEFLFFERAPYLRTSREAYMANQWKWYIYIVECIDGLFYAGLAWKPDLRWIQHISGLGSKFTTRHKPKKVVYLEEHNDLPEARQREKQIKDWSQKKKKKLISGEWSKW